MKKTLTNILRFAFFALQRLYFGLTKPNKYVFVLTFCIIAFCTFAQNRTVSGSVVTANDGMSIPFANVVVKGSTTGAATDINGHFSFEIPADAKQLEVSFMGYKTVVKDITTASTYNFVLHSDAQNLDEVVVVGYGVQKKSHLTAAVAKIGDEAIKDAPVSSLGQALIGKVAGLSISNTTSEAGVAPKIRVRGVGSISASGDPLVVVDGVPISDGLNFVEANDVESVEILKDAASTAIYGSRGANGVIIVTTKQGEPAKPKYQFSTTQGFRRAYKLNERYTYTEYVEQLQRERELRAADPQWLDENPTWNGDIANNKNMYAAYILENQIVGYATDWEELSMRKLAYNHSYNLSVSGGTKDVKYYVSGNVTRDQGIMVNSEFNKISFRAKLDANLSKYIKVGVNLNPSYGERERPFRDQINYTRWWSCFPVYHTQETVDFLAANGKYGYNVGDYTQLSDFSGLRFIGTTPAGEAWNDIGTISGSSSQTQPVWVNAGGSKKQKNYRLQASAYLTANIVKGLSFTSTNSIFVGYTDYSEFQRTGLLSAGAINQATARTNLTTNFLTENMLNYNAVFAKHHNLTLLAGVTYQAIKYKSSQMIGTGLPTESIKTLNQATTILSGDNSWTRIDPSRNIASYLARATYAYQDKYLFSASVRADGSSRFGPENRWGFFPSVSAGWRISEEKFLASAKNWLDQLKFRLSWGITGNDDIEALAYENIISQANYELGNAVAPGMSPTDDALGNPAIGWEQTNEVNAGLDFSIFAGRFAITADYYYAITDGLLLKQSSMAFTGHNLYWNNIGTVRNSGFEIELNTVNIDKRNFKWKTIFNIAHNDPRLLGLGGESQLLTHPSVNYDYYIAIVGQKPIQYYGYKTDGVWKSRAEIDAAIADGYQDKLSSFAAGGLKIKDINGDKIIDDHDKTTIGDPYPDFTWSFTNTFSFYGVDVSIMFQGAQGIEIYNDDGRYNENVRTSAQWNTPNRWVSPNNPGDGKTPFETNGIHKSLTDYVIEDGSYLALRNATIGYTVPTKWITKTKIFKGLHVYFACENPLYVWNLGNKNANKYRGINPEARKEYNNPLTDGLQNGSFAIQSSYVFGLNLTF